MIDFVFNNPTKVYFGKDQLQHLGQVVSGYGKKVLLTYGGGSIKKTGLYDKVMTGLKEYGLEVFELGGIEPNPRIGSVRKGAQICKDEGIDVVLAVGGGSTIDASKWITAGACVDFDTWEFFSTDKKPEKSLPLVTILTMAATGSEMDAIGVISNPETNEKYGRSAPCLFPRASFLNPELTYTVGRFQTACGSADILSHLIETYFNPGESMYMLDSAMEGFMKTVIKYAPVAMAEPENYEARANLMWASSWAINGFTRTCQVGGWSCHPMEHELSAFYDITHGLGLAILTPSWLRFCLDDTTVDRYVKFGVNVWGLDPDQKPMVIARQAIEKTEEFLFGTLGLDDKLSKVGIGDENFSLMAQKACKGTFINGFKKFTPADVETIYRMSL
ncbi:MAG: iron-containing alcohol dehydrogenase [Firmicutes bacterium]|nr:iron-containing alcohol dehydrogenase [Bacillota bacterium]